MFVSRICLNAFDTNPGKSNMAEIHARKSAQYSVYGGIGAELCGGGDTREM